MLRKQGVKDTRGEKIQMYKEHETYIQDSKQQARAQGEKDHSD